MPKTETYADLKGQLIVFFVQYYNINGEVLTADKAHEEYDIPKQVVKDALKDPEFKAALEEQGVVFRLNDDSWQSKSLTPLQLLVANTLLDLTDTRSEKKKLQDLNVSTSTYQAWLKDPIFKEYLHTRAEQLLGDSKHEVSQALRDRVRSGDIKAIEYYNEMLGIYSRPRSNSYGINGLDVQQIIVSIIEIIDDEVRDPDVKLAISEKLKALIQRRHMAQGLTPVGLEPNPVVQGELTI